MMDVLAPQGDQDSKPTRHQNPGAFHYGDLAKTAGFRNTVTDWPEHLGAMLPASWHARAKMVAEAITRAFVDACGLSFPAQLVVDIHPTGNAPTDTVAVRTTDADVDGDPEWTTPPLPDLEEKRSGAPKYFRNRPYESIEEMAQRAADELRGD